jgi:hypothetical protein
MSPRLPYDPMETGPLPLFGEKDRAALDHLIDGLERNLRSHIVTRVIEGAYPLIRRGYAANELQILGFGPEITIEPIREFMAIRLWWRRIMMRLHLSANPRVQDYAQMQCDDYDTQRLIKGLKLFESDQTEVLRSVTRD